MVFESKILVLGGSGLIGSAIVRRLQIEGYSHIDAPTRAELNLMNRAEVSAYFQSTSPEFVFMAAGRVGGMFATSRYPAEFLFENVTLLTNVIDCAFRAGVTKLMNIACSCCYPREAPQPLEPRSIGSGSLEPTMAAFGTAKLAGIEMCRAYFDQYGFQAISVMGTNTFGPNDNFDMATSHALPAMIRKFHEAKVCGAKTVEILGTGKPRREFMAVDDLADGCLFLMTKYAENIPINLARGEDLSIYELAQIVQRVVGFGGQIGLIPQAGDGVLRKIQDVSAIQKLGWKPKIELEVAIRDTYTWYLQSLLDSKN